MGTQHLPGAGHPFHLPLQNAGTGGQVLFERGMKEAEPALAPLHQQPGLPLAQFQEQVRLILRRLAVALELAGQQVHQLGAHSVTAARPAQGPGFAATARREPAP